MKNDVTETDRFVFFWGGWPSQWFKCQFEIDRVTYNCCEQYMMAEKARVFEDAEALEEILASSNPREQKAIGRRVRRFDESIWTRVCRGIVYEANLAKFSQNPDLEQLLLATGEKLIVEASLTDRIWGIGLAVNDTRAHDPSSWRGTNWLGIAITQVRQSLRHARSGEPVELDGELQSQLDARRALR
jgi:ribA/ribD-fused uncharacterized protein